ncbi:hypothetical protein FOZ62_010414 [Perkinsus olseni]|uniref:Uncharacterized protein n=2 Tax=Perkinsus olseni TaxID=32597 RepID=A0A7J6R6Q8_PEROL|nr:hypothetical protein FOZ62_010414 [Perkinsus olseni]
MTSAQEIGEYIHEAEDFTMTYRVNEDYKAVFEFSARPRLGSSPDGTSTTFSMQVFPLGYMKSSTYYHHVGWDIRLPSLTDLHTAIGRCLRAAGVIGSDSTSPPADIQKSDLRYLFRTPDDFLLTRFLNKEILFMRVTRNWSPGKFVYRSPTRPKVKLVYKVRDDGDVMIRVKCGKGGTRRFRFKLSRRLGAQRTFKSYDVEQVKGRKSRHSWENLLMAVKRVCPGISLVADDLYKVVFATDRTIYVPFRGTRVALTRYSYPYPAV